MIMIDYMEENAALVIDKIRDVDIRDFVYIVDQPFLSFQIALPMPEIFECCIITVPIEVMIKITFSEPRMLSRSCPWALICKLVPIPYFPQNLFFFGLFELIFLLFIIEIFICKWIIIMATT